MSSSSLSSTPLRLLSGSMRLNGVRWPSGGLVPGLIKENYRCSVYR